VISALFWDFTDRRTVVSFSQTFRDNLSVRLCRCTMHKIPKQRKFHLQRGGSLKSGLDLESLRITGSGLQGEDTVDLVGGY